MVFRPATIQNREWSMKTEMLTALKSRDSSLAVSTYLLGGSAPLPPLPPEGGHQWKTIQVSERKAGRPAAKAILVIIFRLNY